MKINTTRQALLDALLVVSRAVSARAALQALSGILITADGEARLRATDMELGLEVGLEGEVEGGRLGGAARPAAGRGRAFPAGRAR